MTKKQVEALLKEIEKSRRESLLKYYDKIDPVRIVKRNRKYDYLFIFLFILIILSLSGLF